MTRAIGYARCSTADQSDRGVTLAAQWVAIEAYCTMKGLELVERIEDAGVSGSIPLAERREGRRLTVALKAHGARHVVALKLDRLFRDAVDALQRTKAWDKAGVALHLVDMGGSAIDTSSPVGRVMLTMLAGFAEFERALIAERTRTALQHIKANGGRTGSVPYGKMLCPGWELLAKGDPARKRLYDHEEEQAVVRLVHELHAAGEVRGPGRRRAQGSLRSICAELERRGICTRTGPPFTATQITRILQTAPSPAPATEWALVRAA